MSIKLFLKTADTTPKIIPEKTAKNIEEIAKTKVALNVLEMMDVTLVPVLTKESRK